MGTLTADCPRLDTHCPHKLATSCRLTSTPNCCACADDRAHSSTYRVYIDGVGFVQRGTRWQSYCWFCKEFWNNRLTATDPPLQASQTQIPHNPDQTAFLQRWFEFHQGYRIARNADGTENRIAVVGEPFRDVDPGFLPRTLEELRRRVYNNASRPENRFRRETTPAEEEVEETPQQSLEDALDRLLEEASDEETEETEATEVQILGISQQEREATGLSRSSNRTDLHLHRARERLVRLFGTREDIQRDDYESPLSSMYNRAWDRYRQAEQRRGTGDTMALPVIDGVNPLDQQEIEQQLLWGVLQESRRDVLAEHQTGNVRSYTPRNLSPVRGPPSISGLVNPTSSSSSDNLANAPPSFSAPPGASITFTSPSASASASTSATDSSTDLRTSLEQISNELSRLRAASEAVVTARNALNARHAPDIPLVGLDDQPDRPPALTDEEMTKKISCQVCYSQIADIAVLPCGHMVMCQWCADVVIPVKHSYVPARATKCPMCRKQVKQRFKIHMG